MVKCSENFLGFRTIDCCDHLAYLSWQMSTKWLQVFHIFAKLDLNELERVLSIKLKHY